MKSTHVNIRGCPSTNPHDVLSPEVEEQIEQSIFFPIYFPIGMGIGDMVYLECGGRPLERFMVNQDMRMNWEDVSCYIEGLGSVQAYWYRNGLWMFEYKPKKDMDIFEAEIIYDHELISTVAVLKTAEADKSLVIQWHDEA